MEAVPCFHELTGLGVTGTGDIPMEAGPIWAWTSLGLSQGSEQQTCPGMTKISGKCRPKSSVNLGGPLCHGHCAEHEPELFPPFQLTEKTQLIPSSPTCSTSDFRRALGGSLYNNYPQVKRAPETLCPGKSCFLGKPEVTISICDYNSKRTSGFHGQ